MKRILGIDPSLASTGVALVEDGELALFDTIRTSPTLEEAERLHRIAQYLESTLSHDSISINAVAIEGYAFGQRVSLATMGQVGGVIRLAIHRAGFKYAVWPVASWRKAVLGNARLAKDEVRLEVYKRYAVQIPDDNALEAYCVAMAEWLAQSGAARPRPRAKRSRPAA
ncbi:MAG TPA: crossover junction endodeoxyribonuclease RuvC [Lentzea sp.]